MAKQTLWLTSYNKINQSCWILGDNGESRRCNGNRHRNKFLILSIVVIIFASLLGCEASMASMSQSHSENEKRIFYNQARDDAQTTPVDNDEHLVTKGAISQNDLRHRSIDTTSSVDNLNSEQNTGVRKGGNMKYTPHHTFAFNDHAINHPELDTTRTLMNANLPAPETLSYSMDNNNVISGLDEVNKLFPLRYGSDSSFPERKSPLSPTPRTIPSSFQRRLKNNFRGLSIQSSVRPPYWGRNRWSRKSQVTRTFHDFTPTASSLSDRNKSKLLKSQGLDADLWKYSGNYVRRGDILRKRPTSIGKNIKSKFIVNRKLNKRVEKQENYGPVDLKLTPNISNVPEADLLVTSTSKIVHDANGISHTAVKKVGAFERGLRPPLPSDYHILQRNLNRNAPETSIYKQQQSKLNSINEQQFQQADNAQKKTNVSPNLINSFVMLNDVGRNGVNLLNLKKTLTKRQERNEDLRTDVGLSRKKKRHDENDIINDPKEERDGKGLAMQGDVQGEGKVRSILPPVSNDVELVENHVFNHAPSQLNFPPSGHDKVKVLTSGILQPNEIIEFRPNDHLAYISSAGEEERRETEREIIKRKETKDYEKISKITNNPGTQRGGVKIGEPTGFRINIIDDLATESEDRSNEKWEHGQHERIEGASLKENSNRADERAHGREKKRDREMQIGAEITYNKKTANEKRKFKTETEHVSLRFGSERTKYDVENENKLRPLPTGNSEGVRHARPRDEGNAAIDLKDNGLSPREGHSKHVEQYAQKSEKRRGSSSSVHGVHDNEKPAIDDFKIDERFHELKRGKEKKNDAEDYLLAGNGLANKHREVNTGNAILGGQYSGKTSPPVHTIKSDSGGMKRSSSLSEQVLTSQNVSVFPGPDLVISDRKEIDEYFINKSTTDEHGQETTDSDYKHWPQIDSKAEGHSEREKRSAKSASDYEPGVSKRRNSLSTSTMVLLKDNTTDPDLPIIKIGVILTYKYRVPWQYQKTRVALEIAANKIRAPDGPLPHYGVQIVYRDSQCSHTYGVLEAIDLYVKKLAHVFIGPGCDYPTAPIARYSYYWGDGIPVLTAAAMVSAFVDKKEFKLLTRVQGSYQKMADFVMAMFDAFGWEHVGMTFHDQQYAATSTHSDCFFTVEPIFLRLRDKRHQDPFHVVFNENDLNSVRITDALTQLKDHCRIVVMCAKPDAIREIMIRAHQLNFVNGEYVFFYVDLFHTYKDIATSWKKEGDTDERNAMARKAYEALMIVVLRMPTSDDYKQFSVDVKEKTAAIFPNYTYGEEVNTFVGAFHDSVILYALALNETLAQNGSITDGEAITKRMWNRTFVGITGNVSIDDNGDRNADYSLLDLNPETQRFEVVANYFGNTRKYEPVEGKSIHWPGGRTEPPPDTPKCGFDGSKCPPDEPFPEYAIVIIVLGSILLIVLIAVMFVYRHFKLETELAEMNWRVRYDDILFGAMEKNRKLERSGSRVSLARASIPSDCSGDTLAGNKQLFTRTGYYKGAIVALKPITRPNITVSKPMLLEIKTIRDLQNDHIVRFVGACISYPNMCILTEYCPKGSLQDVLENEHIKLDWLFRYSIMQDIVRGMVYLHGTEVRSHGFLKSTNCVVDSRFVVKITDFSLHHLKGQPSASEEDVDSYSYYHKKLWTAPELLRMSIRPPEGTSKGDVYSFAIICQEIVYRNGVFYLQNMDLSPKEIHQKVKNGLRPWFRPTLEEYDCPCDELAGVIRRCWAEDPADRPDFQALKSIIRKLNHVGDKGNILDNLLSRMEQYANNLEALVEERTADYLQQKKKAEDLLYNMLPKKVASQLIRGECVTAEWYDSVSIYFSDICGFTAMSAECTPMQVVDLLNDLYTAFDSIIENFDVYKVETIGDAYMVVSGLPDRNGTIHAREIARMSLSLLKATMSFRVRHRPNDQLKLRIGIHTGSVCAGVVGHKMPRYCLFGDTVNTCSRMESNGLPLRIHVSQVCKEVLDTFSTFDLELRGNVEMKGKGLVKTYWLQGEKNVSDSPGVSLNIL